MIWIWLRSSHSRVFFKAQASQFQVTPAMDFLRHHQQSEYSSP
jgi:hypothetical protein